MSNSLRPHEAQQARPPCPSPTPRVHPNPCPLSPWCHPTISSSVVLFFCPQSFPASGSFPVSQLFTSGGQSTVVSASFYCAGDYRGWNNWIYLIINAYISSILKLIRKVELLYIFKSCKNYSQKVREYVCIRDLNHKCVCVSHSVLSNSLWPHGLQPARIIHPWNSPGKNTGVGCHFLLQCEFQ